MAIRKLLLLTRSPPLRAILDHLSARYTIRLVFAAADHPLWEYIGLTSRTIQQPWLNTKGIHNKKVHYPTLHRPISLVARYLRAGDVLEDTHLPSPGLPPPPFSISITHLEEPAEGPSKHQEHLAVLADGTILLYTDGLKSERQKCRSAWSIYCQYSFQTSPELASGHCCIGDKAEVYDTELHAIQEGLLYIIATGWAPTHILVCADNQAALLTLSAENPSGTEYAQHTLQAIFRLREMGWSTSGLWTPAYCGIPGNERADALAKLGSQGTLQCQYTKVTRSWLQTQVRQRLLIDWGDQFPPDPHFPIVRSTTFPRVLRKHSPAALRALFRLCDLGHGDGAGTRRGTNILPSRM